MKSNLIFLFTMAICFSGGSLLKSQAQTAPDRQLVLYEVTPVHGLSDDSGRLPAEVWEKIPATRSSFVYWKVEPLPGELQSDIQMAYDEKGLYVRIVNHEAHPEKMRALVKTRGSRDLWTDDCVELYFDPRATGVGFLVFTINSIGAQLERKQLDAAVSVDDWRANNWQVWPTRKDDAWILEAFFPYSDLEKAVEPEAFWMFNMTRYAYTSGKFQGTTWSPGGNYNNPSCFGYLYFRGEKSASTESLAEVLRERVAAPWVVAINEKILRYRGAGDVEILSPQEAGKGVVREADNAFREVDALGADDPAFADQLATLKRDAGQVSFGTTEEALDNMRKLAAITAQTRTLYWNEKIKNLLDNETKK